MTQKRIATRFLRPSSTASSNCAR